MSSCISKKLFCFLSSPISYRCGESSKEGKVDLRERESQVLEEGRVDQTRVAHRAPSTMHKQQTSAAEREQGKKEARESKFLT